MSATSTNRPAVADQEILRRGGRAEYNVSAPSSFIANAHNELYAFYMEKGGILKKSEANRCMGAPNPFESATVLYRPTNFLPSV